MTITGAGTFVAFGEQAVFGTPVVPTHSLKIISTTLKTAMERADFEDCGAPSAVVDRVQGSYDVAKKTGGSLVVQLGYNNASVLLLAHALGKVVTTAAGADWEHTITPGPAYVEGTKGLTMHLTKGLTGVLPAERRQVFNSLFCLSGEISCQVGERLKLSTEWAGRSDATKVAVQVAPNLAIDPPIAGYHQMTLAGISIGGVKVPQATAMSLKWSRAIDEAPVVGDLQTDEPVGTGGPEFSLDVSFRLSTNDLYDKHISGAYQAVTMTFTDGTRAIQITAPRAQVREHSEDVSGRGVIDASASMRLYATDSLPELAIVYTNDVEEL